jgi:nucleoside-diphosphate-sugar epimerase
MVGSHLIAYLCESGFDVTGFVRNLDKVPNPVRMLERLGNLHWRTGDLTDAASLSAALADQDVVIHAAGAVDPHGRRKDIFDANVQGTANLLVAATVSGVKQFIHISSLSVITDMNDSFGLNEEAPLRLCGEAYADSKVEAEKLLAEQIGAGGTEITILRPGFIYGPRERAWMPRLVDNLAAGKVLLIDGGQKETNVIYIGNLCRAAEACLLNAVSFGRTYNLTDGERVTKKRLFDTICDGLSLPRPKKSVPRAAARLVCEGVSILAPLLSAEKRDELSRFSRAAFRLAAVNQSFDITRAERELGYVDRVSFADGMAHTLRWFSAARQAPAVVGTRV